jgi:hypothetical protein
MKILDKELIEPAHKLKIPELSSKKFQNGTDEVVDGDMPTLILIQLVGLSGCCVTNIRFLDEPIPGNPYFGG